MTYAAKKTAPLLLAMLLTLILLASILPAGRPASASFVLSEDGWGWQNPLPQGNNLMSVWGTSPSDVYAVGVGRTILRYSGKTWANMAAIPGGSVGTLYGVWGSSASDIYAVGSGGTVLHYESDNWIPVSLGISADLRAVCGTSADDIFAVGASGTIVHYDGTTWDNMTALREGSPLTQHLYGVWAVREGSLTRAFAVGAGGTTAVYDGTSWQWDLADTSETLWGVCGTSATNVWAVGTSGTVLRYDGANWSTVPTGLTPVNLRSVWCYGNQVFAAGDGGAIWHYDGSDWLTPDRETTQHLYGIWGADDGHVYAVGNRGAILEGAGGAWTVMSQSVSDATLNDVWGYSVSNTVHGVWAVGSGGTVLHYDGLAWHSETTGTTQTLNAVHGTSATNVWAVGRSGTVLKYDGTSWSAVSTGLTMVNLNGVWCVGDHIFAVGDVGAFWHSTDKGSTWSPETIGTLGCHLRAVWGTNSDNYRVVGGVYHCVVYPYACHHHSIDARHDSDGWTVLEGDDSEFFDISGAGSTIFCLRSISLTQYLSYLAICRWDTDGWVQETGAGGAAALCASTSGKYAVGNGGTILRRNSDATWPAQTSSCSNRLNGIWVGSSANVWAVGDGGTILHYGETPTLDGIDPDRGKQGETRDVIMTGTSLGATTSVDFGDNITVNSFTIDNDTQVTANITVAREATLGERYVTLTTPVGPTAPLVFRVDPVPLITSVDPDHGLQDEAIPEVTIEGRYFTGATAVSFGEGIAVSNLAVTDDTRITVRIDIDEAAEPGPRDVLVTITATTGVSPGAFRVDGLLGPAPASVSPSWGIQGQTLDVIIGGSFSTGADAVDFGPGIAVGDITPDSAQVTASVTIDPEASVGARDVTVTAVVGTRSLSGTLSQGFVVLSADVVKPASSRTTTGDKTPAFEGSVKGAAAYVAVIEYRVDGSRWLGAVFERDTADSSDGTYSFTTFLLPGDHVLEIRALDESGSVLGNVATVDAIVKKEGTKAWVIVLVVVLVAAVGAIAGYLIWRYRTRIREKAREKVEASKRRLGD